MSDSELSDGLVDLPEILAEYETKNTVEESKSENIEIVKEEKSPKKEVRQNKNKKSKPNKSSLAVPMDKVLFGDKEGFLKNLAKAVGRDTDAQTAAADQTADDNDVDDDEDNNTSEQPKRKANKRKPVWTDADDEVIQVGEVKRETKYTGPLRKDKAYKEYLTANYNRIVAQPKWASLEKKAKSEPGASDDDAADEDDALLRTVGFLAKKSVGALRSHTIQCKRLKDLNRATYAEGSIKSVQFHPSSTAALVAGDHGIATIYAIDGRKNPKLHCFRFENFPIECAKIFPCGQKAIFGSRKQRHYFSYDLQTAQETRFELRRNSDLTSLPNFKLSHCGKYMIAAGRSGTLHLFDAVSQELIHSFKQEGMVGDMQFTADSLHFISNSNSPTVNIFSMRQRRLEHKFFDEGCIMGRALDLAPNQRLLAMGSREGVVNVYDFADVKQSQNPVPLKTFYNLTTPISDVRFNHSSEILAMCSDDAPSAIKLAHFPSGLVYANFPGFKSGMGKPNTAEFSPNSGYFAVGNQSKQVSLFRLKHFENY